VNYLPNEITLSTRVTNRFSYVKQKIGVTPNIMARVAILKALESDITPELLETPESLGQKIPKDIAFGEYTDIFGFAIKQYIDAYSYSGDIKTLISNLIETGAYKIGNIKKPQDVESLF
jgi:DNA sulfur modification protein DndE